jgi:hypothetical protein
MIQSLESVSVELVNTTRRPALPGTQGTGSRTSSNPGLDGCGKSRPNRDLMSNRPARRKTQYRLCYPGPYTCKIITKRCWSTSVLFIVSPDTPFHTGPSVTCVVLIEPVTQLQPLGDPRGVISGPSFIHTQHVNQKMSSSGRHKSLFHD